MSHRLTMLGVGWLTVLVLSSPSLFAQGIFGKSPAKASLLAYQSTIQPGSTFRVGVLLTPEEGWHTYWINPGESGLPTKITWELPAGFTAGDIQWPAPHTFETGGIIGLGYAGTVLLTVPITAPATLTTTDITLKAKVTWLACKEACIPGRASLSVVLPVKNETPSLDPANQKVFEQTLTHLPKPLDLKEEHVSVTDGRLTLTLPGVAIPHAVFYSANESLIDVESKQTVKVDDKANITTISVALSKYAPKTITHVTGVVVTDPHAKVLDAYAIDVATK